MDRKTYWWNLLGVLGAFEYHFEAMHLASKYGAVLKRDLYTDLLLYALSHGWEF